MRVRALLVLLLVLAGLAGCASVPESSPVQVLRRVGDGGGSLLRPVKITTLGETISGDDADEGALTDLACSADQDDASVSQRTVHLRCGATWDQVGRGHTPC